MLVCIKVLSKTATHTPVKILPQNFYTANAREWCMWIVVFACTDIRHIFIDRHTHMQPKKHTRWHTQAYHATRHALPNDKNKTEERNTSKWTSLYWAAWSRHCVCMCRSTMIYLLLKDRSVPTAYDAPLFHLAQRLEQTSQQRPQVQFGGETNASISSHICVSQREEHVWLRFAALDSNMDLDLLCISNTND